MEVVDGGLGEGLHVLMGFNVGRLVDIVGLVLRVVLLVVVLLVIEEVVVVG